MAGRLSTRARREARKRSTAHEPRRLPLAQRPHQALGRGQRPRQHACAALRLLGVRGRARVRHAERPGLFPPGRPHASAVRIGQGVRDRDWLQRGRDRRRLPRGDPRERLAVRLRAADRVPRRRRPGRAAEGRRAGGGGDHGDALGRLSRRRGGARRGRVRLLVAPPRAEHHPELGQGRRQLPQQPADRAGSAPRRLRRRHRAGRERHALRGRGREPVPGQARQAAHAAVQRRHPRRHHARQRADAGRRAGHRGGRTRTAARGAVHRRRDVHDRHRRRDHPGALGGSQAGGQRPTRPGDARAARGVLRTVRRPHPRHMGLAGCGGSDGRGDPGPRGCQCGHP